MQMWKLIAVALYGASAARTRRSTDSTPEPTKFIGDVPILNYDLVSFSPGDSPEAEWTVVMKKGVKDDVLEGLCTSGKCLRMGHPSKGGVPFFEVRASEDELESIVKAAGDAVKFVEPDTEVSMLPVQPGAESYEKWNLNRIAVADRPSQGEGVNVYVLDTGVLATHNDFGGRVIPALDMTTGSLVECNGGLGCAADRRGHGTHCAGTAAGNNFGVASKATVRSVKVLSNSGSGMWSWSYEALDWLATKGARPAVASMSLGGSGTQFAMQTTVDAAVDSGVVVVVAGGNENTNDCSFSPAFVPSAITVGSTTRKDARSPFSNYGSCTDIWAPGSDIVSAYLFGADRGNESLSGTSMACPHVAGASALLLEASPNMAASDVLTGLLENAVANAITGLRDGDTNKLLYVGAGGPPPTPAPVPTPAPPPFVPCPKGSTGPDRHGDCRCNRGSWCFHYGVYGACRYSGGSSTVYFLPTCDNCECQK